MENNSSRMLNRRVNFEFAFNDADFSDRVLHIEITDDSFDVAVVKVKTLHISSLLLAGNNPFFHQLLKNDMTESKQRDATLRILASEEAGTMDLLNFMYSNTLKATSTSDLLRVLVVADKFEATDCVRYCCESLQKMPMSLASALEYLELPSSVLLSAELVSLQPLIDASKKCLLAHFKDIERPQEEAMTLPLSAVEVLLGSDDFHGSEDDAFEFMLKWSRAKYPELYKRREILSKNMVDFLCFEDMSSSKLKEVLVCPDLDREVVGQLMLKAFIRKVEDYNRDTSDESHKYPVRKVEQSGTRQPRCVIYFELKKQDCENLLISSHLNSESFCLGGRSFYLSAKCNNKELHHSFDLALNMNQGSQICSVYFQFAALEKSSMKFRNKGKIMEMKYSDLSSDCAFGDLCSIPWTGFMSDNSEYFIDGMLHLRVDLTIKESEA